MAKDDLENDPDWDPALLFFTNPYLPPHLQRLIQPFFEIAHAMIRAVPRNSQRHLMFQKMVEAKDCALRAVVFQERLPVEEREASFAQGAVLRFAARMDQLLRGRNIDERDLRLNRARDATPAENLDKVLVGIEALRDQINDGDDAKHIEIVAAETAVQLMLLAERCWELEEECGEG